MLSTMITEQYNAKKCNSDGAMPCITLKMNF